MNCKHCQEQLALYFYEELTGEERAGVEAHLDACRACADAAGELRRLHAALTERAMPEPTPDMLARCRLDLEEALDHEEHSWRALVRGGFGLWPMGSALRLSAALAVLLVGFSLGWTLHQQPGQPIAGERQESPWVGADLSDARISGISQIVPDPQTGDVRITLDAERRFILEGSLDDPRIQQVLLYAARSYDNPGIRHDTLRALRSRSSTPAVRDALLYALQHDPNDAVRQEALQTLEKLPWSAEIRLAVLHTLEQDSNPGVRVAAVNLLARHADEEMMPMFEELSTKDSNPYVRMKSASTVREQNREEF